MQRAVDRHGGYIERTEVSNYNNTGHSADVISDQLGRTIVIEHATNEDYIRVAGVGGVEIVTTVKWSKTFVSKVYRAGNHFQFDVNLNRGLNVVSEIDMPVQLGAGLKYLFGYNGNTASGMGTSVGWGELSSVTLPSDANVTYQYDMDNQSGTLTQANWVLDNAPSRKTLNYTLEYDNTTVAAHQKSGTTTSAVPARQRSRLTAAPPLNFLCRAQPWAASTKRSSPMARWSSAFGKRTGLFFRPE